MAPEPPPTLPPPASSPPWTIAIPSANVRTDTLATLGAALEAEGVEVAHAAEVVRVARELARRHLAAPGTITAWPDGVDVLVRVVQMAPAPAAAGPPASALRKGSGARKRAEALARRKPPAPRPYATGAVRVGVVRVASKPRGGKP